MSLTPPAPEEHPDPDLEGPVSLPSEVVQPVLRFMEKNRIGRMRLNVEALDVPTDAEYEPTQTLLSTALLDRERELYSDEAPQGGMMGAFITIECPQ
jgi:hypothetical protein